MPARWKLFAGAIGVSALIVATGMQAASPALAASSVRPASAAHSAASQAAALRQAKAFLSQIKVGAPMHGAYRGSVVNGISQLTSTNWSGYGDAGATHSFTTVSGTWVEPTGTCTSGTSLAAFWVGLDGLTDGTVEQDGTIIECSGGQASNFDWWETYPGNAVQIEKTVTPGDKIVAKVSYNGSYSMSVTDSTHSSANFSVSEPCGSGSCNNANAEWIAEAPCCTSGSNVYPLTNFGTWKLKKASTTYNGTVDKINGPPTTDEITMKDSGNAVKAQPSALNAKGNAFSVVWKKAN